MAIILLIKNYKNDLPSLSPSSEKGNFSRGVDFSRGTGERSSIHPKNISFGVLEGLSCVYITSQNMTRVPKHVAIALFTSDVGFKHDSCMLVQFMLFYGTSICLKVFAAVQLFQIFCFLPMADNCCCISSLAHISTRHVAL